MGTRSYDERNRRTLQKSGAGSYSLTIPIQLIRGLRWQVHQEVVIERRGQELVIRDAA